MRSVLALALLLTASAPARAAEVPATAPGDSVIETLEVKREDVKAPEHASLRFLKDHRVFVRAQLDRLRTQVTREHAGAATPLDPRYLKLQEMSAAIAAAQDTIGGEQARASERSLLTSVKGIGELEASLDRMDSLLVDQRTRLLWLEQDFLGHQETALVIVVQGSAGKDLPAGLSISDDHDVTHVAFSDQDRASLAQGGIVQVYHQFVEPRTHALAIRLEGAAWEARPASVVTLTAARDRLTFLELDLGKLEQAASEPATRVWYR